jgi:phenylpyruvate tautomerase PptA (4-oxalocrotonate tautomerase family)
MPLARIDLLKGKDAAYRQEIGRVVYDALVAAGVPVNDRFQVITEHEPANFIFAPEYLGIHHSDDLVMIQITWNEGRTTAQKQALYKAIADGLHAAIGLRREDVVINLVEVKKENWSFGNGVAQYAN